MLLVDDDEPELAHRREERAARADGDVDLAVAEALPHPVALARREARVEDRDVVAEARAEAGDELRRERDLGDEHDRAAPGLARGGDGAQVHLGLAAAGDAVEEERLAARAQRAPRRWPSMAALCASVGSWGTSRAVGSAKNGSRGASRSSTVTRPRLGELLHRGARAFHRSSSLATGSAPDARTCAQDALRA